MAEAPEQSLAFSEGQIMERIDDAGEKARVGPLDPDFLLILLLVAIPFDIVFAVLEIVALFTAELPKLISIPLNIIPFIIICGWSVWRTGQMIKRREEQKKSLEKAITKQSAALQKQLTGQMAKKGARVMVRRVLIRGAIAFLGGVVPIVALIPFWTITVILTLKEK